MNDNTEILASIVDYNGFHEYIKHWLNLPIKNGIITCPDYYCAHPADYESQHQLQIIWMIGVLKFGDYGTSPRYGWILYTDKFKRWVKDILSKSEG